MSFQGVCDIELPLIVRFSNCFRKMLDDRPYCQADMSSHYDDEIAGSVAKRGKHPQGQMRSQILDSFDLVSILSFPSTFKLLCDMNSVQ